MRTLALLSILLLISATSLQAEPTGPIFHAPPEPIIKPIDSPTPPAPAPSQDEDTTPDATADDPTGPVIVEAPESIYTAPVPYVPAHYSIDDLAGTMHSLAPDPSDPSHHSMSEIGGL